MSKANGGGGQTCEERTLYFQVSPPPPQSRAGEEKSPVAFLQCRRPLSTPKHMEQIRNKFPTSGLRLEPKTARHASPRPLNTGNWPIVGKGEEHEWQPSISSTSLDLRHLRSTLKLR
jgi:hypothetical protein